MTASGQRFRDLQVWVEALDLARVIYRLTASYPIEERFGLVAQMRRAAVSVPSNIAEGSCRRSRRDFARFVDVALGSLAELETQLEIAVSVDRSVGPCVELSDHVQRARRMLYRLRDSLVNSNPRNSR